MLATMPPIADLARRLQRQPPARFAGNPSGSPTRVHPPRRLPCRVPRRVGEGIAAFGRQRFISEAVADVLHVRGDGRAVVRRARGVGRRQLLERLQQPHVAGVEDVAAVERAGAVDESWRRRASAAPLRSFYHYPAARADRDCRPVGCRDPWRPGHPIADRLRGGSWPALSESPRRSPPTRCRAAASPRSPTQRDDVVPHGRMEHPPLPARKAISCGHPRRCPCWRDPRTRWPARSSSSLPAQARRACRPGASTSAGRR